MPAALGLLLLDDPNGPLNLVVPSERVVTARWLSVVAIKLSQATDHEPKVTITKQGICFQIPRGAFTQRSRLMHLDLPDPIELRPDELLQPPRVLYINKLARLGVLCADQPVSGRTLWELCGPREVDGHKVQGLVELHAPTGTLQWQLTNVSGLLDYQEIREIQQPILPGTCSLEAWSLDVQNSSVRIVLAGPVGHEFQSNAINALPGIQTARPLDNKSMEVIVRCAWGRHDIWQIAERLGWSQRLYPLAPFIWHDEPGSRILLDSPQRCPEWPL